MSDGPSYEKLQVTNTIYLKGYMISTLDCIFNKMY